MRFLVDAQLPPALARWFRQQGCEAQHVFDLFSAHVPDLLIWQEAARLQAIIVTKDEDFPARAMRDAAGPAVLWLRVGNTSNAALIRRIEQVWDDVRLAFESGERLIELRD
ncbi:DUF5615 family PIN-like protein [Viridibacterium curvum]|uniref:DUF5615 domain-containing protein n=1 Tax=Viridibacterium curvum TaxID=1101404 RepID=A0ABP9QN31_9RHOO